MAIIERRNVLDLIGRHRNKYHSCILTCYNFDFSFFEERVLPALRTLNVKNVNILADGHYLEQAQELTTGKEFLHNKTYNFLPVYEQGVFHPKIMLLTGTKHGLLIIGSGNITSSGLSTNDEIWGAFQLDDTTNENAPLFAEAWNYLQTFTSDNYGFLPQKIEWIKKYSPWLEELPKAEGLIQLPSIRQEVLFLSNKNDASIYQQILSSVPKDNLKTLTVISPYYDKSGKLLKQLINDYNPETFNCIVDTNSGILPIEMDEAQKNSINFYDWKDCKDDYINEITRLHAKLFHFSYSDGTERLLLGSANATMAGMGAPGIPAKNAEASLLISREQGNWLKDLKIKLPARSINISGLSKNTGLINLEQQKSNYPYRIFYSELKGSEISCYVNKESKGSLSLVVINRSDIVIETVSIAFLGKEASAKVSKTNEIFKVYLVNEEGERVSNYSIVHRLEMLLRCNPDPTQEKIDALMEQEFPNGDGVTALLEYIDYNWADDETETKNEKPGSPVSKNQKGKEEIQEKTYDTLGIEEFNKVSDDIYRKQSGLLSTVNVKLADFLNLVLSGTSLKESDYRESEEQKLLEDIEQKGEGEDVQNKSKPKAAAFKEKKAIQSYFNNLEKHYANKISRVYKAGALNVSPDEEITINSITKILIATQLVHIYFGKKFMYEDEGDLSALKEERYLTEGTFHDDYISVKVFLVWVLGKFLLLSTAGIKKYSYAILNEKISNYRQQLFEKILFIILNLMWKTEVELHYRITLLLNLHYFIVPEDIIDENWIRRTTNILENLQKRSNFNSSYFDYNIEYYNNEFLPSYIEWLNKFKGIEKSELIKETQSLNIDNIIFSSKFGFNCIYKIIRQNPGVFDLKREGFDYSLDDKGYILKNVTFGNKIIKFK